MQNWDTGNTLENIHNFVTEKIRCHILKGSYKLFFGSMIFQCGFCSVYSYHRLEIAYRDVCIPVSSPVRCAQFWIAFIEMGVNQHILCKKKGTNNCANIRIDSFSTFVYKSCSQVIAYNVDDIACSIMVLLNALQENA